RGGGAPRAQRLGLGDIAFGRRGAERGGVVVVDAAVADDVRLGDGAGDNLVTVDGEALGALLRRHEPGGGVAWLVGGGDALLVACYGVIAGVVNADDHAVAVEGVPGRGE